MKVAVVPSAWLGVTNNWLASKLIRLAERVSATNTDPNDLSAVLAVCHATDAETAAQIRQIRAELRGLDDRRKVLTDSLKALEPILPTDRRYKRI